jgi:hypothetical protein
LLCKRCNRRRGSGFEQAFLVNSVRDHLVEPSGIETVEWILLIARFGWDFYHGEDRLPMAGDYANTFTKGEISPAEEFAAHVFADIVAFFHGRKPGDLTSGVFRALKLRWGAADGEVHRITDVSQMLKITVTDLVSADRGFLRRLGFSVRTYRAIDARWSKL